MSNLARHTALVMLLGLVSAVSAHATRTIVIGEGPGVLSVWSNLDWANSRGAVLTTGQVTLADPADLRTRRVRGNLPPEAFDSFLTRAGLADIDSLRPPVSPPIPRLGGFPDLEVEMPRYRLRDGAIPWQIYDGENGDVVRFVSDGRPTLGGAYRFSDPVSLWPNSPTVPSPADRLRLRNDAGVVQVRGELVIAGNGFSTSQGPFLRLAGSTGSGAGFVSAVPEPEVYAMLAAGLGLIGWKLRRRQRRDEADAVSR